MHTWAIKYYTHTSSLQSTLTFGRSAATVSLHFWSQKSWPVPLVSFNIATIHGVSIFLSSEQAEDCPLACPVFSNHVSKTLLNKDDTCAKVYTCVPVKNVVYSELMVTVVLACHHCNTYNQKDWYSMHRWNTNAYASSHKQSLQPWCGWTLAWQGVFIYIVTLWNYYHSSCDVFNNNKHLTMLI